jgi:hypothetical protein
MDSADGETKHYNGFVRVHIINIDPFRLDLIEHLKAGPHNQTNIMLIVCSFCDIKGSAIS